MSQSRQEKKATFFANRKLNMQVQKDELNKKRQEQEKLQAEKERIRALVSETPSFRLFNTLSGTLCLTALIQRQRNLNNTKKDIESNLNFKYRLLQRAKAELKQCPASRALKADLIEETVIFKRMVDVMEDSISKAELVQLIKNTADTTNESSDHIEQVLINYIRHRLPLIKKETEYNEQQLYLALVFFTLASFINSRSRATLLNMAFLGVLMSLIEGKDTFSRDSKEEGELGRLLICLRQLLETKNEYITVKKLEQYVQTISSDIAKSSTKLDKLNAEFNFIRGRIFYLENKLPDIKPRSLSNS